MLLVWPVSSLDSANKKAYFTNIQLNFFSRCSVKLLRTSLAKVCRAQKGKRFVRLLAYVNRCYVSCGVTPQSWHRSLMFGSILFSSSNCLTFG